MAQRERGSRTPATGLAGEVRAATGSESSRSSVWPLVRHASTNAHASPRSCTGARVTRIPAGRSPRAETENTRGVPSAQAGPAPRAPARASKGMRRSSPPRRRSVAPSSRQSPLNRETTSISEGSSRVTNRARQPWVPFHSSRARNGECRCSVVTMRTKGEAGGKGASSGPATIRMIVEATKKNGTVTASRRKADRNFMPRVPSRSPRRLRRRRW